MTMQSKKVSPVPTDFDIDDYIGMESCVDLKEHHATTEIPPPTNFSAGISKRGNKMWGMRREDQEEYPPPIPLLVRTENLASHMPWVLKRHYTGDGRLILTEERVRHHEFFRAHRSDGRLMLQLVAVDDQFSDESDVEGGGEDCTAAEGGEKEDIRMVGGGAGGKCYKYENVSGRDGGFMFEAKGRCR